MHFSKSSSNNGENFGPLCTECNSLFRLQLSDIQLGTLRWLEWSPDMSDRTETRIWVFQLHIKYSLHYSVSLDTNKQILLELSSKLKSVLYFVFSWNYFKIILKVWAIDPHPIKVLPVVSCCLTVWIIARNTVLQATQGKGSAKSTKPFSHSQLIDYFSVCISAATHGVDSYQESGEFVLKPINDNCTCYCNSII